MCRHYAGEIWKRSFISTVIPIVHSYTSRRRSFSKTLFQTEEFENAVFSFLVWTENVLKTELFETDGVKIIKWFSFPKFPQTQIQNDQQLLRFQFLRRSVDGKHLMRFQRENSVFKFIRRRVDWVQGCPQTQVTDDFILSVLFCFTFSDQFVSTIITSGNLSKPYVWFCSLEFSFHWNPRINGLKELDKQQPLTLASLK